MKNLKAIVRVLLTAIPVIATPLAWSDQQPVTAYYDAKHDWFVFEWMNLQTGKRRSFYDSSDKVRPMIHSNVTVDKASGAYKYQYAVSNLLGAVQLLHQFFIPHPSHVFESTNASPEWRGSEYRDQGTWQWHKLGPTHGLRAGESASGFSFQSKGLPTIVTTSFAGDPRAEYTIPSPDSDPEAVQIAFEKVFSEMRAKYPDKFIDRVQLKTLGPIDPPVNFVAADFIQNLLSLEVQSVNLGWIKNQGFANSLQTKLDHAKMEITACRLKTATNIVSAFVNEVREAGENDEERGAARKEHKDHDKLTSEAYALMYFNGKYLLTQLEKKTNLNCPAGQTDSDHDGDDSGNKKDR